MPPNSEHLVGPRGAALMQPLTLGCCLHHTRDLLWAGAPGVLMGSVVPCSWSSGMLQELRCGTQALAATTANTTHTQTTTSSPACTSAFSPLTPSWKSLGEQGPPSLPRTPQPLWGHRQHPE